LAAGANAVLVKHEDESAAATYSHTYDLSVVLNPNLN